MRTTCALLIAAAISATVAHGQLVSVVPDFAVSGVINKPVYYPSIAVHTDGTFGVSWGDERTVSDGRLGGVGIIAAAIFSASGTPLSPPIRVDDMHFGFFHEFSLFHGSPVFLPNGTFAVAYHVDARTTIESIYFSDVYYSAFSTNGTEVIRQVALNKVNNSSSGYCSQPSIAALGSNLIVAYRYNLDSQPNIGISLVDGSSGLLDGNAVGIADNTNGERLLPYVASNGSHTTVVWTDGRLDPSMGDVYMQRFVGLNAAGGNVKVNSDPAGGFNQYARVAMNTAGGFVVVWIDTRNHNGGDLYARLYDSNGIPRGSEFKLTSSNSVFLDYPPGVSMDTQGNFAVAWADSTAGKRYTAKTRIFSSSGIPLTGIAEITTSYQTEESSQPDVRMGPGGRLYYTWLDGRLDRTNGRIFAKIATYVPTSAERDRPIPLDFALEANFPNPFNPVTTIRYRLPEQSHVRIEVYNQLGEMIHTVVNAEHHAGIFDARWNADAPSGVYYCRMQAIPFRSGHELYSETRKIVLMK